MALVLVVRVAKVGQWLCMKLAQYKRVGERDVTLYAFPAETSSLVTIVVVITVPEKIITVWLGAYLEPEKIPSVHVGA